MFRLNRLIDFNTSSVKLVIRTFFILFDLFFDDFRQTPDAKYACDLLPKFVVKKFDAGFTASLGNPRSIVDKNFA